MSEGVDLEGVPKPGDVVDGKYRVERVLGVGGMGAVVAATHVALNQRVAIKFLLDKIAQNEKSVARFLREAQAAALIQSDHVAKVSDVGTRADGAPYMVMEYLDGEDLSDRIERVGALPQPQVVGWVLQAGEALAEAHKMGIVHRDLKPANLFLARRPDGSERIKLLDFGISKVTGRGPTLTKTSALMGSPLYMAPEQMKSAKYVDARSDIWALGCILFEALSGIPPFVGETLPEICSRILTEPPTPIRSLLPSLNSAMEVVLARCLDKQPERRYQSVAELAFALAPFGGAEAQRSADIIARVLGVTAAGLAATAQGLGPAAGSSAPAATVPGEPHALPAHHAPTQHATGPQAFGSSTPDPHTSGAQASGALASGAHQPALHQLAPHPSAPHMAAAQTPALHQPTPHEVAAQTPAPHTSQQSAAGAPPAVPIAASPGQGPRLHAPAAQRTAQPGPLPGVSTAAPVETSAPPPTNARPWLWAAAAALLLCGIGGAALLAADDILEDDDDEAYPALVTPAGQPADNTKPADNGQPADNGHAADNGRPAAAQPSVAQVTIEPPAASASSAASAALNEPPAPPPASPTPPARRPHPHLPLPTITPPPVQPQPGGVRPGDDLFNTHKP